MTERGPYRRLWRVAAVEMVKRGHPRYAMEAMRNGVRRRPPYRWRTGQPLARLSAKIEDPDRDP